MAATSPAKSNGVVIVAPSGARWAVRAQSMLADVRLFVARLYEPGLLPLLMRSGGVRAVAIDCQLAVRAGAGLRESLAGLPAVRVIVVHDGGAALQLGGWRSRTWPDDAAALRELVGEPPAASS